MLVKYSVGRTKQGSLSNNRTHLQPSSSPKGAVTLAGPGRWCYKKVNFGSSALLWLWWLWGCGQRHDG